MLTVVAALIKRDDRLLVCQRRRDARFGLMWEFPGGKAEKGETPERALGRELLEELGVVAHIGAEVYRTQHKYAEMPQAIELVFFAARIVGEPRNLDFEQIAWREPASLTQLDFLPADCELIEKLAAGSLQVPKI